MSSGNIILLLTGLALCQQIHRSHGLIFCDRSCLSKAIVPNLNPYGLETGIGVCYRTISYETKVCKCDCRRCWTYKRRYQQRHCCDGYTIQGNRCQKVSHCQAPPINNHVRYSPFKYSYNTEETVEYSCHKNYKLHGNVSNKCKFFRFSWQVSSPTCSRIRCGLDSLPPNAEISQNSSTTPLAGMKYRVTCMEGYYSEIEYSYYSCTDNETLEGGQPPLECKEKKTCPQPKLEAPAFYLPQSKVDFESGDLIHFECPEGQITADNFSQNMCDGEGNWKYNKTGLCVSNYCQTPELPENVEWEGGEPSDFVNDNHYLLQCAAGYSKIEGGHYMKCNPGNKWTWSSGPLKCQKTVTCGEPPSGTNMTYSPMKTPAEYLQFDRVEYSCTHNTKLAGNYFNYCNTNGQWSLPAPICTTSGTCTAPELPNHVVFRQQQLTSYQSHKLYYLECEVGYNRKIGSTVLACGNNTWVWNGTPLECEQSRSCGALPNKPPPHLTITALANSTYYYPDYVSYSCPHSYHMEGPLYIRCQKDGNWSSELPSCHKVVTCSQPTPPPNAVLRGGTQQHFQSGRNYPLSCENGYYNSGSGFRMKCNSNKEWDTEPMVCKKKSPCGKPPNTENVNYSPKKDIYQSGEVVKYFCPPNYKLPKYYFNDCSSSGEWSRKEAPTCVKITPCTMPRLPAHSTLGRDETFSTFLNYRVQCETGYDSTAGNFYLRCNPNNYWTWVGTPIVCTLAPICEDLSSKVMNKSQLTYLPKKPTYYYGDRVIFMCPSSHTLEGNKYLYCQQDNKWNSEVPECKAIITCPEPILPAHAVLQGVKPQSFQSGPYYFVTCDKGYLKKGGGDYVRCDADQKWTGNPIICN